MQRESELEVLFDSWNDLLDLIESQALDREAKGGSRNHLRSTNKVMILAHCLLISTTREEDKVEASTNDYEIEDCE